MYHQSGRHDGLIRADAGAQITSARCDAYTHAALLDRHLAAGASAGFGVHAVDGDQWAQPSSRVDFYRWDGSFLRSLDIDGALDSGSVDGAYVANLTRGEVWSSDGTRVGTIDIWGPGYNGTHGRSAFNWAADGDYFCSLEMTGTSFALLVEDVFGRTHQILLDVPADLVPTDGIRAMQVRCGLSTNRAIVWRDDQPQKVALFSLPDGKAVSEFALGTYIALGWSADLHWLVAYNASTTGSFNEVIDTTTGVIGSHLDGYFGWFTPDGQNLVGTDSRGIATVLDWRSGTPVWTGPGHVEQPMASSDPTTNKMLLWLSTGTLETGTATFDYWIVDGRGSGFRFTPRNCVSIVASPARVCAFG